MRVTEKRTQIYLTRAQHAALLRMARRRKVSLAQVVREALDAFLDVPSNRKPLLRDPLDGLVGFVTGPDDLAENHDEYLSGPRRKPKQRSREAFAFDADFSVAGFALIP
jgi:hypothetical protein